MDRSRILVEKQSQYKEKGECHKIPKPKAVYDILTDLHYLVQYWNSSKLINLFDNFHEYSSNYVF